MLPQKFLNKKDKKILLIRPDAIGDVVLMLPLINSIKATWPEAKVYTLQQSYTKDLFKQHPNVEQVIIDWRQSGKAKTKRDYLAYARYLKSFQFDMVIHCFFEPYFAFLVCLARIPIRIGDGNKIGLRPYVTHPTKIPLRQITLHETMINTLLLNHHAPQLKVSQTMDLYCDESLHPEVTALLTIQGYKGQGLIGIHPTTGGGNRAWSPDKYAKLIDLIYQKTAYQVLLTGAGKKDAAVNETIMNLCQNKPINLAGKTSIESLKCIIMLCEAFIGTDTGPTHMSAGLNIPVLCVSPTKFVKSLRWGPWQTPNIIVGEPQKCDIICNPYRCNLPTCLEAIEVEDAFINLKELIRYPRLVEETQNQAHWFKASVNVGLFCASPDPEKIKACAKAFMLLKEANMTTYVLVSSNKVKAALAAYIQADIKVAPLWNLATLIRFIQERDINLIHLFPKKFKWFWQGIIRQFSATKMYCPPKIVSGEAGDDLVSFYLGEYSA